MPTSMYVFADIARKYGIDPTNDAAIDEFFITTVPTLTEDEQQAIFTELLQRENDTAPLSPTKTVHKLVDSIIREELATMRQIQQACTASQSITELREHVLKLTKALEDKRTRQVKELSQG